MKAVSTFARGKCFNSNFQLWKQSPSLQISKIEITICFTTKISFQAQIENFEKCTRMLNQTMRTVSMIFYELCSLSFLSLSSLFARFARVENLDFGLWILGWSWSWSWSWSLRLEKKSTCIFSSGEYSDKTFFTHIYIYVISKYAFSFLFLQRERMQCES